MNLTSLGILSASVVVGVVGAGAAYQLTSVDAQEQASASVPAAPATQATQPRTRWAPCSPPAALEGKECVVDVTRTVTLPGEPAAAAPAPARAPATVPGADGPRPQKDHGVGTHATEEADDDRGHDTIGSNHDEDDSTDDAKDDAADAAEDAAKDAEDAAKDAAEAEDDRDDKDD